ncbi:hypothetical protein EUX98_g3777 [Antrodiella citrinella]|uniref:Chitin-binding type-3 domain-containing protein n=1 Tax=Antrodiella citrinella TaxID=2447956 RepID=A0A4S4MXR9_9APHY|nr:hypothetical protein EUX98_g3777 [Antrodiella citrinella]
MPYFWEPGTQYNIGDEVEFEGFTYKIIQPHQSQSDWTPPATPALWARIPVGDHHYDDFNEHEERRHEERREEYQYEKREERAWDDHQNQAQEVAIHREEQKQNWYDITDERKKQLEIGGGLLVGAAAIGAGYLAYRHHQKSKEEKQADVWSLQAWLKDAQFRTQKYHQEGPRGPATWLLVQGKNIPQLAIRGGEEVGEPLFIARFFIDGSIQVGKASHRFELGALVGYRGEEIPSATYEILVGDLRNLRWVNCYGRLDINQLGGRPVEGGKEADGTPLFIIQTRFEGGVHPGKVSTKMEGAIISYGGREQLVQEYHVLCYQ